MAEVVNLRPLSLPREEGGQPALPNRSVTV